MPRSKTICSCAVAASSSANGPAWSKADSMVSTADTSRGLARGAMILTRDCWLVLGSTLADGSQVSWKSNTHAAYIRNHSEDAYKRIADCAQSILRRISQFCAATLIAGAVAKAKVIDDNPCGRPSSTWNASNCTPRGVMDDSGPNPNQDWACCGSFGLGAAPLIPAECCHSNRTPARRAAPDHLIDLNPLHL
jgi:hypothetical protein